MRLTVLCLLAGCDRLFALEKVTRLDAQGTGDDDAATSICLGSGLLSVCVDLPLPPSRSLSMTLNTDQDSGCIVQTQTDGRDLCVIAAQNLSLDGDLVGFGQRPLVLVATDSITIGHTLNVASTTSGRPGAGTPGSCGNANGDPGTIAGGGGAGGSFGFLGGDGGDGGSEGVTPAAGGSALAPPVLAAIRGGCSGGLGAIPVGTSYTGGGQGGGAVYLIAGTMITVTTTGSINASGAGGRGGAVNAGGGGGGAGGFIAFDAPEVEIHGEVFARGGGGGGGGGVSTAGAAGGQAIGTTGTISGGSGGDGGTAGGDGCDGGNGGGATAAPAAGGGGGGACGIIRIFGDATPLVVSQPNPAPT